MIPQSRLVLINPVTKAPAFQLSSIEDCASFARVQRCAYYTLILVTQGSGMIHCGVTSSSFTAGSLLCISLYEPFRIESESFKGSAVEFHPEFFCIYKHEQEIACNGVLFNSIYQSPVVALSGEETEWFVRQTETLWNETRSAALSQYEMLTAHLKVFLITAVRIKTAQQQPDLPSEKAPFILQTLKDAIEENYRSKRSASEYAELLHISTKALNRISKKHLDKTLSDLIAERIVIEAKRELYITIKPVKQIAYELGFNDEFYFSRFFKQNVSVSPQTYRNTIGFAKGEAS